jgi:hypothetical protein
MLEHYLNKGGHSNKNQWLTANTKSVRNEELMPQREPGNSDASSCYDLRHHPIDLNLLFQSRVDAAAAAHGGALAH